MCNNVNDKDIVSDIEPSTGFIYICQMVCYASQAAR